MKRKARIQTGIDDRLVAIYARKSRITNKGDSIGVQFKQSADYAINQLSLPEDYEFARYEDKGLSGYYSDRPDFQRLLRDIEMGKIKAVACYKLDRISRKTSDLMRLLEYFERHDVTLLVCSNNINTRISTSKIIIQVLAIIAEFERDILTERIQDNLMELAKDGRWLGGKTPTGFSSQRVTTGSGKNKSAISFLVPVQEEKEIVLEIYGTFWETRSLLQTANIINEKYETKHGAKFTTSTIRLILRNPIYCVADEYSYNYFLEHDGNLFGEPSDFDGQHGLTAYNKTDQMKVEDEDSTFFNPKFSQLLTRKPISEWIVSVGRHEGFISSRKWVETQNMLDEIAEKYNRPHRKTNALLSGLMYCPICGKRLRVLPESNRWTNGKPRFKYACPGVRAKECTFKGVEGVTLDEFVIHSLSSLQEEHSDYYRQLLENRVASMIRTDQSEKEYQETKKAIERLNADIAAQVRNLREADDALKRFIQDDIKELTDELAKREAALRRMEDTQSENQYLIHELNGMKKRLLSFEEFAKGAQPEALFTLVHSIVDRIYITTDGTKQKCQVYIKGCATEDYSDVLGAAGYIEEEPLLPVASYVPPMCDLDYYSILNVTLTNRPISSFVSELLTPEQLEMYRVYLQTSGNKPLVFGGGSADTSASEDLSGVQFVNGTRPGNTALVDIAKSQVGNVGGQPYWSWYGFDSRVAWCACFVSWCYGQAGLSEPRFAGCQSQGVPWFTSHGQWGARGYENIAPGDAIFFDWDLDGSADHVGIVIGTDGSSVYTVEGNSGDACKIRSYPLDYACIKGYGLMNWN